MSRHAAPHRTRVAAVFQSPGRLRPLSIAAGLLALALAAVALTQSAHAADASRVLLLHVDGKNPQAERDGLFEAMRTKLASYSNLEIVKAPEGDITDQMIELECIDLDDECLGKLATQAKAQRVIHAEAGKRGRLTTLKLRIVDSAGKSEAEQTLEGRDATALAPLAAAALEAALGPPPPAVVKGRLMVEVSSPTASIYLGAELIGTGTATVTVNAGEYTIRVTHAGSEEVIRKVKVLPDDTTVERITLVPLPIAKVPDPKKDDDEASAAWVPWVIAGAAVLGGTVAAILLLSGDDDSTVRGPAVLGIDPNSAWRDPLTNGGRR